MKTIEIKIYKFEELSEEAQQKAIDSNRTDIDNSYIYDEAHETVKEFNRIFDTEEGNRSWLEFTTSRIDDNVLEMKGMRLRTWIINNFGDYLYTPKFIGSMDKNEVISHKRIKSKKLSNGNVFNPYYSGCQKDNCCVLTGVCYDDSILQPVYDLIEWNEKADYNSYQDFESLMTDCFQNLERDLESELEAMSTDEYISDHLIDNEYDFTEEGEIYN